MTPWLNFLVFLLNFCDISPKNFGGQLWRKSRDVLRKSDPQVIIGDLISSWTPQVLHLESDIFTEDSKYPKIYHLGHGTMDPSVPAKITGGCFLEFSPRHFPHKNPFTSPQKIPMLKWFVFPDSDFPNHWWMVQKYTIQDMVETL